MVVRGRGVKSASCRHAQCMPIIRHSMSIAPVQTATASRLDRPALLARYQDVRRTTERLCRPLGPEDHVIQAMPDVSPAKWHLAHVSWFFETFLLAPHLPGYVLCDPAYRVLFNSLLGDDDAPAKPAAEREHTRR